MKKFNRDSVFKFAVTFVLSIVVFLEPIIVGSQTMTTEEYESRADGWLQLLQEITRN